MSKRQGLDIARGRELIYSRPHVAAVDQGFWHPVWTIDKYIDHRDRIARAARAGLNHREIMAQFDPQHTRLMRQGNCLLNAGINMMWTAIAGTGATLFNNANAYIGVGDSSTAAAPTQTGLQAATNKTYQPMNSSYPTYGASQLCTWQSTFSTSQANYAWNEVLVCNSSGGTVALNRYVSSMGTKTSAASWVASLQVTLS